MNNPGRIVRWWAGGAAACFLSIGSAFALDITVTSSPYNAVAEDGRDDSTAFRNALNAIVAAGGGTLSVPCGNYDFTNKVTVDLHAAAVTIAGDGANVSVIRCATNNTSGVFLFTNSNNENQLTMKDFTIEADQLGGTAIADYNPSLSTNAICSLRMDDVNILPATDQVQYFTTTVDASNLKSPVFYNVIAAASIQVGYNMEGYHIANVDSPTFEQTYAKHHAIGYHLTGMRGAANFYRSYTSDVGLGYSLAATTTNATLSMRHFHSGAYQQGLDISGFGQVEILEHMCYGPGNGNTLAGQFLDQVFTDCANVNIKGTIYNPPADIPRTMISLRGNTHDVYIENCVFRTRGTVLAQDPSVHGVIMVGCEDDTKDP
ncbi:MAG: hypothetical protein WCS42_15300 [Verrucomicrobiota bacterium]